jgi:hypothetical protein
MAASHIMTARALLFSIFMMLGVTRAFVCIKKASCIFFMCFMNKCKDINGDTVNANFHCSKVSSYSLFCGDPVVGLGHSAQQRIGVQVPVVPAGL